MGLEAPVALTPLARGRGAPTGQAWGGVSLTKRVRLGAGYGWLHLKGRKRPSQTPGLGAGGGPHLECPQETRGTVCGDTCDDHDCGGATGFYWVEATKHPATQIQPPMPQSGPRCRPGTGDWTLTCRFSSSPRSEGGRSRPWPGSSLGRPISGAIRGERGPPHGEQTGARSRGLPSGGGDGQATNQEMPTELENSAAKPVLVEARNRADLASDCRTRLESQVGGVPGKRPFR